jgi:hypothetical protein
LTQTKLANLEDRAILVESDLFEGVNYAIDRSGEGMWILIGDQEIPLRAEQVHAFAREFTKVWDHMRPRTVR